MPHYKAPDNSLHFLDSEEFEFLLPSGSIKITDQQADAIRAAIAPKLDPAAEVNAKLNAVRVVREAMLNRMAGIALVAQIDGDTVTVEGYKAARTALLDITKNPPADPAQVDAFIMLRYIAIRDALPGKLITAFAGVDQ